MSWKVLTLLMLGVFTPSIYLAQNKNRISLQTGLFHNFFDGSAIVNSKPNNEAKRIYNYKILSNLLNGIINDSRGFSYERTVTEKSAISIEYMVLSAGYNHKVVLNNSNVDPQISARNLKFVNLNYTRKLNLNNKFAMTYGGGINYCWGRELIYHYTLSGGWGEPRFYSYQRNDFGLNGRLGIEFKMNKSFTLYTNLDYLGIFYLGVKELEGDVPTGYYAEKFDLPNLPSRNDLSWRFGIGFNF